LACCAGKAPHAAGSCMHGACDAGDSIHFVTTSDRQHAHHHDDQQAQTLDSDNNAPQILAGVTAGVCGTEMELVPTIEAAPDQPVADDSASAVTPEPEHPYSAVSATTISQSCQSDCGACTSGFATNRSRNTASLTVFKSVPSPLSILRARVTQSQAYAASVYSHQSPPRGPPSSSSL
jgi:hypothetical protein